MRRVRGWLTVAFALGALGAGALGGCGADDLFPGEGVGGGGVAEQIVPAPGGMRRLLARQYVGSVRVLFVDRAAAAAVPPDDSSLHGFATIGNALVSLDEGPVEEHETPARLAAAAVVADGDTLAAVLPCTPKSPTVDACYRQFIRDTGRVAWRRDLSADELDAISAIAVAAGSEYGLWQQGIAYSIVALLTAPDFLYVV